MSSEDPSGCSEDKLQGRAGRTRTLFRMLVQISQEAVAQAGPKRPMEQALEVEPTVPADGLAS